MESLALLCTLHADGPATLKRLRRAGCDSLKTIESYGAADLATLLEVPPAVARRLLKEARGLSARLDDGVLDDAEEAPQVCTGPAPYPASGSTPGPQVTTQGFLDQRDYAILGRVLEHWSDEAEADAVDSQVGSSAPLPAAAEVASEINSGIESERLWPEDPSAASCGMDEERAEEAECTADAPSGAPPLRAGDFEGLDEAMIAALGGAHIESLSDVLEADALVLAEILGVTYANARRTQYLARAAESKAEVMAEPMAEVAADPPVSIDAPDPEPDSSPVSLAFGARWRESAPSLSGEDPSPARKFWEPRPSAAAVAPDPGSEELVIEMRVPGVEAADAPSAEVPTAEERVSAEEGPGADAKPEATPEPACEPSDDPGPKRVPPESPMPDAATYGTPWPQDAGPELTRPLHVRFPSEPPEPEAMQAEDAVTAQGSDRPLNWNFDLTGPSVRFPENAPGEPPSGYSAAGHSADDPGRDGVGGPFA